MTDPRFAPAEIRAGDDVLVYGAGGFGRWVSDELTRLGVNVQAVVDRNPASCGWTPAITLTDAAERHSGTPVVLGVFSPQPDVAAIATELESAGLGPVVSPPQLFAWLGENGESADRYWLTTDTALYRADANAIAAAALLMSDHESRDVFRGLLAYRASGDVAVCPRPRPLAEQHTGLDFGFLPTHAGVVVDCGAYTGDTFANWEAAGLHHEFVLALEPDDSNFATMTATAANSTLRVIPMPAGVAEHAGRYRVEGSGPSAVLVASDEGRTIAVALDEVLASVDVSLIKMDIEGGEAGALRGAIRTLRRNRPRLAISVYHKPWHLWSIVNWLATEIGGYRFTLRVYGHQGYDTVLYAVPSDS